MSREEKVFDVTVLINIALKLHKNFDFILIFEHILTAGTLLQFLHLTGPFFFYSSIRLALSDAEVFKKHVPERPTISS